MKTCESCGQEFSCGADKGKCWCFELPVAQIPAKYSDCLCPECIKKFIAKDAPKPSAEQLIENEDYYTDKNGLMVFTEAYLSKRGYCCKSGCRHCPYSFKK